MFPDGQIWDDLFTEKFVRPVFTSDNLFVWDDLSVQTICSSSSVKTADDKALFLWKKGELIEFSGTLRSFSVCKFKAAFLVAFYYAFEAYNPQLIFI